MSLRRSDKEQLVDDSLDGLIRWALHDSVADAEPSPQVWERIRQRVVEDAEGAMAPSSARRRVLPRRLWLAWLIGAGADYPVLGDPRAAWQRRLHSFDMRASLSVVRIVEAKMPTMRLVS
jgi:hypothetical protein